MVCCLGKRYRIIHDKESDTSTTVFSFVFVKYNKYYQYIKEKEYESNHSIHKNLRFDVVLNHIPFFYLKIKMKIPLQPMESMNMIQIMIIRLNIAIYYTSIIILLKKSKDCVINSFIFFLLINLLKSKVLSNSFRAQDQHHRAGINHILVT